MRSRSSFNDSSEAFLGIVAVALGAVFAIAGSTGHAIGGRSHWF